MFSRRTDFNPTFESNHTVTNFLGAQKAYCSDIWERPAGYDVSAAKKRNECERAQQPDIILKRAFALTCLFDELVRTESCRVSDTRVDIISVLEYEIADNGGAGTLCKLLGR